MSFPNRKFLAASFVLILALLGGMFGVMPVNATAGKNQPVFRLAEINQPPVVSVGPDQTITVADRAFLHGIVSDDNLPNSGMILSAAWSQVSGPGAVTFGDENDFLTWATFSSTGTYVLRLTVGDGQLSSSDDLNVVVNSAARRTIRVPQDFATIQAGINAAQSGDLVLVSPGTYVENLTFGKAITLASTYYTTGDESLIDQTVIRSPTTLDPVILVGSAAGPETRIIGFTIKDGDDGIKVHGHVSVFNSRFFAQAADAIDYAGASAGLVMDNYCEGNVDDCVDIDDAEVLIEHNQMVANGEGVEIRTVNRAGPQLTIIIRDNLITGSRKTGLQVIDVDTIAPTAALIVIDRNLITNNAQSGLSLMDNKITTDDYRAASLLERIHLFNNTFVGNFYGAHGGDNLVAVNNIFAGHPGIAVKQIDAGSILSHNLFWNNGTDNLGSNLDAGTTIFADPLLDTDYKLQAGSPAIDAGTASFGLAGGETVLSIPPAAYSGAAPDLGKYESNLGPPSTFTPGPSPTPTNTPTATNTPTPTPTFSPTPPASGSALYLSLSGSQTIAGVASADEDILRFDGSTWSLFFDGSDVGVASSDLMGFSIIDADTILMSFSSAVTVNGLAIAPQDVVRFDASSLGSVTSGMFSMYLDGSDVGLDTTAEKIDALSQLPDGRVLISTTGNPSVPGVAGRDEDVLAFAPASLGEVTSGTWAMYFDGSDAGLAETSGEDVDALDVIDSKVYLSTADVFSVNGLSGFDEDVFVCEAASLGDNTVCNYSPALYFDGSTWGLSANDVDAFSAPAGPPPPGPAPTSSLASTSTPTPTATPTSLPGSPDLIFADGFESADLTAWSSSSTDLGDLSVSSAAALAGGWGLQAVIDDNNALALIDESPVAEPNYRAGFLFDPNSIVMANGDAHFLFKGFQGTSAEILRLEFRYFSGAYQLRAGLADDGSTWTYSAWFTISDTPHLIELDWRSAGGAGMNNGGLVFWIDGVQQALVSGIDNDTRRIDRVRLGALAGIDTGTRGAYYFDAFESHRLTNTGP